ELLALLVNEYKEPEYIMDENGIIYVTESSIGVVFNTDEALKIMGEHTQEGESFVIACEVKKPKHTKEELEAALFRDTLGKYTTNFSSSSANRASNIALATGSINGVILMPGDVFSFNGSVGERTVSRGYKTAGAYVAGETVDQVGGGICQVSSTLYNTVLLSNLQITERRSHQMTVSYVPMGRDATVNWGTTDFRFKNNTEYPVKIVGTISGRNVAISIVGTETIDGKKVEIATSTVSVLEPMVETVEDPEKEVGFTQTKNGSKGYVVDATRIVYSNGTEVSRESLVRSRYNPKKTVVTVGTKVVEVPTEDPYKMPPGLIPVEEWGTQPAA
ncbi:MAG: VanW family protein, partial [Clostridia bacterium]|nr:VanW family protein [Clostridia bacterium]